MSTTTSHAETPADGTRAPSEPPGDLTGTPGRAAGLAGLIPHLRRLWPYAACLLALFLAWPAGWAGQATWWHLPLSIKAGGVLLLGGVGSGIAVAALVREPWARFGITAGMAALSWASTNPPAQADHGRLVLGVLLVLGLFIGLLVGDRAGRGVLGVSIALAVLAGASPSTWPHAPLLAVAVALPFWLATRERVAPTLWAVVRALVAFVVARVVATAFTAGWVSGTRPGISPVHDMTRRVGAATWDTLWHKGFDIGQTALTTHTSWIWGGVVLAVWIVVGRVTTRGRRQ